MALASSSFFNAVDVEVHREHSASVTLVCPIWNILIHSHTLLQDWTFSPYRGHKVCVNFNTLHTFCLCKRYSVLALCNIKVVQLHSPQDSNSHWEEGGDRKYADPSHNQLQCCKLWKVYLVPLSSRVRSVETSWKSVIIWTSSTCFIVSEIFLECMKCILAALSRVKGCMSVVFIW
jgi:hypothetical protein